MSRFIPSRHLLLAAILGLSTWRAALCPAAERFEGQFFRGGHWTTCEARMRMALLESGVKTIRFPGGTYSHTYLFDSPKLCEELGVRTRTWFYDSHNWDRNLFVRLENLLAFCKEAGVGLIYQLPTCFVVAGGKAVPFKKRTDIEDFVRADYGITKWLDVAVDELAKKGIADVPQSVTECMTHRMEDWDSFRLVPTLAHALAYVSNWGDVLRHPRNNMGVFHDLQSAYFGLMQFDVWWDEAERKFVQISPEKRADHKDIAAKTWFERRYVISPTGCVNRMLSEMCGAALLHLDLPKDSPLAGLAAERGKEVIIVIANRQGIPADLAVSWPGRPLTDPQVQYVGGDSPCAALPGEYRTGRLKGNVTRGSIHVTAPPFSIVQIKARLSG